MIDARHEQPERAQRRPREHAGDEAVGDQDNEPRPAGRDRSEVEQHDAAGHEASRDLVDRVGKREESRRTGAVGGRWPSSPRYQWILCGCTVRSGCATGRGDRCGRRGRCRAAGARARSLRRRRDSRAGCGVAEGRAGRRRPRRGEARQIAAQSRRRATPTASSSCATASSRASGTSTARGRTRLRRSTRPRSRSRARSSASPRTTAICASATAPRGGSRSGGHAVAGRHGARPPEHGLRAPVETSSPTTCGCSRRRIARRSRSGSGRPRSPARCGPTTTPRCRRSTACSQRRRARASWRSRSGALPAPRHGAHHHGDRTRPATRSCSRASTRPAATWRASASSCSTAEAGAEGRSSRAAWVRQATAVSSTR